MMDELDRQILPTFQQLTPENQLDFTEYIRYCVEALQRGEDVPDIWRNWKEGKGAI